MKILLLLLSRIGDTLMFTPTLREIRKAYPKAQIDALVMFDACKDVLKDNKDIDKLIHWHFIKKGPIKSLFFMLKIRKQKYDLCITPYPANKMQYNLISFLTKAKQRLAHKYPIKKISSFSWLQTKRVPTDKTSHAIEENLKILPQLKIKSSSPHKKMFLRLNSEDKEFASNFMKTNKIKKPLIGFHPGTSRLAGMPLKKWPEKYFARLMDLIKEKYPHSTTLIFRSKDEQESINKICRLTRTRPIIPETKTIKQAAAILRQCSLLIANDSGLIHMAAIFKVPTITITGPTNEKKTVPRGREHRTIFKNIPCRPCYQVGPNLKCRFRGKNKIRCLRLITPEEVFRLVRNSLQTCK
ncbi:MAG: glycosyltransferase family 9 protein [Nanoarchaeota archaeon]|nr:glycosyltransferase family 9 protein [Nanoarchaeota archaeon]